MRVFFLGGRAVATAEIFIWRIGQWRPGAKAPVGGLGNEVPQKLKQFVRHCLHILTAETIKIWKYHTLRLLIVDQCVSRWGKKRPIKLMYWWNSFQKSEQLESLEIIHVFAELHEAIGLKPNGAFLGLFWYWNRSLPILEDDVTKTLCNEWVCRV